MAKRAYKLIVYSGSHDIPDYAKNITAHNIKTGDMTFLSNNRALLVKLARHYGDTSGVMGYTKNKGYDYSKKKVHRNELF